MYAAGESARNQKTKKECPNSLKPSGHGDSLVLSGRGDSLKPSGRVDSLVLSARVDSLVLSVQHLVSFLGNP